MAMASEVKIKKPYEAHKRVKQHIGERSRTQQNFGPETDINRIMAKYEKTGLLTHVSTYAGQYGDFSGVPDYKSGLERIMAADEMFMSLPARIRDRFNNDPAQFIEFATDEKNLDSLREMGLAPKPAPAPAPTKVEVVNPPDKAPKEPQERSERAPK